MTLAAMSAKGSGNVGRGKGIGNVGRGDDCSERVEGDEYERRAHRERREALGVIIELATHALGPQAYPWTDWFLRDQTVYVKGLVNAKRLVDAMKSPGEEGIVVADFYVLLPPGGSELKIQAGTNILSDGDTRPCLFSCCCLFVFAFSTILHELEHGALCTNQKHYKTYINLGVRCKDLSFRIQGEVTFFL